jgi:hypothetical protein
MYDNIAELLGDGRASGHVSHDRRKKPDASQTNLESSWAASLIQASATPSIAIDPVLEAVSLEMKATQGINTKEGVRYLLISTAISLISIAISLIMWAHQTKGSNVNSRGWRMRRSPA